MFDNYNFELDEDIKKKEKERKSKKSKLVSNLILLVILIGIIYKVCQILIPAKYDASIYKYTVDLSTMKDVSDSEEETEWFNGCVQNKRVVNCVVTTALRSYVNGRNGAKREIHNVDDEGIGTKIIEVDVSGVKVRKKQEDVEYQDKYNLASNNLARLYKSATGYCGVYNSTVEDDTLGQLELISFVYVASNGRVLGEVHTGKRILNSMGVLKRETIYEWR